MYFCKSRRYMPKPLLSRDIFLKLAGQVWMVLFKLQGSEPISSPTDTDAPPM